MLTLILNDDSMIDIELNQNIISQYIEKSFRHLQNLPLSFHIYDYLKYYSHNKKLLYRTLIDSAKKLNINIDEEQLTDQKYLNFLHKMYEFGYNKGSNVWLEFHEMIHAIEAINHANDHAISDEIIINFRERAGPLEKPFDREYLKYSVQSVTQGMCYCRWSELGKVPSRYWIDNEPDDIQRLCQLAKPWTILRPSFSIALENIDFRLDADQQQGFNEWFSKHKQTWMQYWNLSSWSETEMNSVIPIGHVKDISLLVDRLHSGATITKVNVQ